MDLGIEGVMSESTPLATWPRPSPFPICTFILLIVNIGIFYGLQEVQATHLWGAPIYAMNVFFFWAERNIYTREKRNFDGWHAEIAMMMERKSNLWDDRVRSITRQKKGY